MKNEILTKGQTRTMTVKEIASAIGVAESTIRNKIAELFPNRVKNGIATCIHYWNCRYKNCRSNNWEHWESEVKK